MQLNSTTLHVELRRYRLPHRRKLNCRRRSAMQLKALVDMSYKQACFFSIILLTFFSNSSLQNSISRQTRQSMSYMTSWPTNWVNWVTTFRTDRWQLFTLWTCRQLDVELICVAINGPLEGRMEGTRTRGRQSDMTIDWMKSNDAEYDRIKSSWWRRLASLEVWKGRAQEERTSQSTQFRSLQRQSA